MGDHHVTYFLLFVSLAIPSFQHVDNHTAAGYQISQKPCRVKGQEGKCMFVWECVKTEGTPLGMCMERFMFGSCCAYDVDTNVVPNPPRPSDAQIADATDSPKITTTTVPPSKSTIPNQMKTGTLLTTLVASRPPAFIGNTSSEAKIPVRLPANSSETVQPDSVTPFSLQEMKHPNDDLSLVTNTPSPITSATEEASSQILEASIIVTTASTLNTTIAELKSTTDPLTSSVSTTERPSTTTSSGVRPSGSPSYATIQKMRPKPYRRTTTRRYFYSTTEMSNVVSTSTAATITIKPLSLILTPPHPQSATFQNFFLISDLASNFTRPDANPFTIESHIRQPTNVTSNQLAHFATLNASSAVVDEEVNAIIPSLSDKTEAGSLINVPTNSLPQKPSTVQPSPSITETKSTTPPTVETTSTTTTTHITSALPLNASLVGEDKKPPLLTSQTTTKPLSVISVAITSVAPVALNASAIKNVSTITVSTLKPNLTVTFVPSFNTKYECGVPPLLNRQEGRIVGGTNAKFGSWPWQISVRRTSFFGFSSTHRCGGALLNEQWAITAGHCVDDLLVSQIRLRMGEYDFTSTQELYPYIERGINKKIVHPKYNFFTYEYDLALVRLEEPVTFQPNIAPICLPATDETLIGQNGTVTGWGRLSEGGTLPSQLQQVNVPIVSNDKCKDMFLKAGRNEHIPDIFMCAGYEEGGRDSCQGDSGGPLQIRGNGGRYFLAGIISWGIGCAEANLPGVCTRISKFTSWILENTT